MTASPVDPDGLMEFSVVFTDRSLNHMSKSFQRVMTDLNAMLCEVYQADAAVIVPGGGTFAMEAVARQFATDANVMVIRNGWFSYRWTQIFDMGAIPAETTVIKASQTGNESTSAFAPQPIEEVTAKIREMRPSVVFAPHVETSSGVILPDEYLKAISEAARDVGALFVLDCIASGCIWVDMKATGVDVLISAPQKGWSASPCAGLVMLGARALDRLGETKSTSFAVDLRKWHDIMQAYVGGGHAYHSTMPTDALKVFRDRMVETRDFGFDLARERQWELGRKVRALLSRRGFKSVAADGFEAPGVVVSYTKDPEFQNGKKFSAEGMQIAAGVPLMCDEPADFRTFRLGLFGLDKLGDVDGTVARLETVLEKIAEA
ncbi:aminotransferase class V-fold PLP-dependent enzyme [Hoeflea sp. BAL378]|uniref:aminotransferase class V-fold PLP-dependent enzyme n=1 Tax=Hoeflea sp. BAL378 TaxID=1547437 RepID=UPI001FCB1971|nr:aminotransferase class V-fold PLP-dependent enzyme [Hoeflea sp. BAL378]